MSHPSLHGRRLVINQQIMYRKESKWRRKLSELNQNKPWLAVDVDENYEYLHNMRMREMYVGGTLALCAAN
jgi:hypothetical protein